MSKALAVSQITGPAATAVERAREGQTTEITARNQVVALVTPAKPYLWDGGKPAGLPKGKRLRISGGLASDQVVEDRR